MDTKNCVFAYTCITALTYNKHMHKSHAIEVYSALACTASINKTQDTILVSCQVHKCLSGPESGM